jgi:CubicO group peptidase (beta-lactamase class C family)
MTPVHPVQSPEQKRPVNAREADHHKGIKSMSKRMHEALSGYVSRGEVPGLVALVCRRGDVQVETIGRLALGNSAPIQRDTIFRIASMTKPVAAVGAMILVEEGRLTLDEPLDRLIPELAHRRVLKRLDGPLDDTVAAQRPLTLRDLLTLRMGMGYVMADTSGHPIQRALRERHLLQGPPHPQLWPESAAWIRALSELPLMHQPGEAWMYDLGMDVLGLLISRASGQPLDVFLRERLFEPLGMKDTGFYVPATKLHRFATSYAVDPSTGSLTVYDEPTGGQWSRPPAFPAAASGLVSTADDYLAFAQMLLGKGTYRGVRCLSPASVALMTTDQLTPEQKNAAGIILGAGRGWGLGLGTISRRPNGSGPVARYGWDGGLGTSWCSDPEEGMIGILLTQVNWTSPVPPKVCQSFWATVDTAKGE